jgi:hypothetical protein
VFHTYSIYGLILSSNVPLAGLLPVRQLAERADIDLVLSSSLPDWTERALELPSSIQVPIRGSQIDEDLSLTFSRYGDDEYFQLSYSEGARFVIDRDAARIWGTWSTPLTIEDAITFLVGPVLGFALRRRSIAALHASSVRIHDHAVVLCGESEAGKSTTAAFLSTMGFPVLAEDISAIRFQDGDVLIEPGYPRVCLWPDSVAHVLGSPDALPALTPTWEKRFLSLDASLDSAESPFARDAQPLGAIYILGPRSDDHAAPYFEELSRQEALLSLVQNTYMNWLLDREQRAIELDQLARILAATPVRRITPHSHPVRIAALCELIVRDAEPLLAPASDIVQSA